MIHLILTLFGNFSILYHKSCNIRLNKVFHFKPRVCASCLFRPGFSSFLRKNFKVIPSSVPFLQFALTLLHWPPLASFLSLYSFNDINSFFSLLHNILSFVVQPAVRVSQHPSLSQTMTAIGPNLYLFLLNVTRPDFLYLGPKTEPSKNL
jgi:hypothetical protein